MSKAAANLLVLATFSVLTVRSGLGRGCFGPNPVCAAYWKTPAVFLGRVTRIDHVYDTPPEETIVNGEKLTIVGPGQNLVYFDVAKNFRGAPGERETTHTPDQGSSCGFEFE